jgi:hypothetical protein
MDRVFVMSYAAYPWCARSDLETIRIRNVPARVTIGLALITLPLDGWIPGSSVFIPYVCLRELYIFLAREEPDYPSAMFQKRAKSTYAL